MKPTKGCDLYEFNCAICGKPVCTTNLGDWVYKYQKYKNTRKYYCCSWACLRKATEQRPVKHKRSRAEDVYPLIEEGLSLKEIAAKANIAVATAKKWKEKYCIERGIGL